MNALDTPVLFLVFNRPEHTKKVFERIREAKPKYLFVTADGPRISNPEDLNKCRKVREIILGGIDWHCELKTLFREENLGCGRGPAEAITWFFKHVEEGIILEDDCYPDISFFQYCKELLEKYRDENRIMHISGNNFQYGKKRGKYSYYFSIYSHSWGWATWRRSWDLYDYRMMDYNPKKPDLSLERLDEEERKFWLGCFDLVHSSMSDDIWDYQWCYAIWKNNGLSILPNRNLVKNIGFSEEATHTKQVSENLESIPLQSINMLDHPKHLIASRKADGYTFKTHFLGHDSGLRRIKNRLLKNKHVRTIYDMFLK